MNTRTLAADRSGPPGRPRGGAGAPCSLRRGSCRWAAALAAAPLLAGLACAAPEGASTEIAAISAGPGDIAPPPEPVWRDEDGPATLAPTPGITLTATRAEPAYRFRGMPSNDVQGVSYRWWLGSGRAAVGFGLGTIGYVVPVASEGPGTAMTVVGSVPTATIGVRYAITPTTQAYADGSRARGLAGAQDILYNAKAGVEWKPAKSRLGFEGGRLGLQLDSGYRMSLRTRKGGLTIYLRRTF